MATCYMGDDSLFENALSGSKETLSDSYLERQKDELMRRTNPSSMGFVKRTIALEKTMKRNWARQSASTSLEKIRGMWQSNTIRRLNTLEEFQHCPDIMKRFMMVNPVARRKWASLTCDGYQDVLGEAYQKASNEELVEYRMVTDGVVRDLEDDKEYEWEAVCVMEDEEADYQDITLSTSDQSILLENWEALEGHFRKGEFDPTSEVAVYL